MVDVNCRSTVRKNISEMIGNAIRHCVVCLGHVMVVLRIRTTLFDRRKDMTQIAVSLCRRALTAWVLL